MANRAFVVLPVVRKGQNGRRSGRVVNPHVATQASRTREQFIAGRALELTFNRRHLHLDDKELESESKLMGTN